MKILRNILHITILAFVLLCINSCTKDEVYNEATREDYITFSAALDVDVRSTSAHGNVPHMTIEEQEWSLKGDIMDSRGKPTNSLNGLNVGMYAFSYNSLQFESATSQIDNQNFRFVDNEKLRPTDTKNAATWNDIETSDSLYVYGYAPIIATNSDQLKIIRDDKTATITYQVPANAKDQIDIIATDTKSVKSDYKQNIPLTFKHILTGVRFKAGFDCTVKSLKVCKVMSKGKYIIGDTWDVPTVEADFVLPIESAGRTLTAGSMITDGEEILMMIPQSLPNDAYVEMVYTEGGGAEQTITASLKGLKWELGALVTYTINKTTTKDYIYFDLHAGNVKITPTSYTGYVYVNGVATKVEKTDITNDFHKTHHYYIYQSTGDNKATTGWESAVGTGTCRIPEYAPVKVGNKFWSEYITNNDNVEEVIEAWDSEKNIVADASNNGMVGTGTEAVRAAKRSSTENFIYILDPATEKANIAQLNCEITIDNIYSRHQCTANASTVNGGIKFFPKAENSTLTINLKGDNRVGNIFYSTRHKLNDKSSLQNLYNCKLTLQGTGSLTAATVNFAKGTSDQSKNNNGDKIYTYYSNYWRSAIGGNDGNNGDAQGIYIKSGTIFAGTTASENCTAIGGGGNDVGEVYIEGGAVTAVVTGTGTAIGGGIGFNSTGGVGHVTISGGKVFAYNHANEWEIPSAAIGSAGSWALKGGDGGIVNISGGYVYAQSALGTAIGGGSSKNQEGGNITVNISGNAYVTAKSIEAYDKHEGRWYPAGNGIGGGTGGVSKASNGNPAYGGSATIKISGNPTIRTGSVGGGKTNNPNGKIGHANITIAGGDISAQFIMAGGAGVKSTFDMSSGTISNSDVKNKEFYHASQLGGAVYMEDGEFTMSGDAKIRNCSADAGGAVYIKKSDNSLNRPIFSMSGGTIEDCASASHGGAIYLENGEVVQTGGTIQNNVAQKGNGGGIYIAAGDYTMNGTTANVLDNSALQRGVSDVGNGGGIYITSKDSDVNVNIIKGYIKNNTCDANGGGLCVNMSGSSSTANVKVGETGSTDLTNPDITFNTAVYYGGGLYAIGEKAEVTINGGIIMNNTVVNYVPNENVTNERGTVKLNGGDVTHVVVTFNINADDDDSATFELGNPSAKTVTTKIVTATNSELVQPEHIARNFYIFTGWNTRPDGEGTPYKEGDLININKNTTLYAQWVSQ